MRGLTPKQQRFVEEYLVDLNATQAATRAGYSFAVIDGFYVYLLIDPRCGAIFYVGKGSGRRVNAHVKMARNGVVDNAQKYKRITEIHGCGMEVVECVFSGGLSEADAFSLERELIHSLRDYGLTNIANGVTDNAERVAAHAQSMLSRLRGYDDWITCADKDRLMAAKEIFGDLRAFYDRFVAELVILSEVKC